MPNIPQHTLDGKVALITGGARGQGEVEARLFAAAGARVILSDVLDEPGEAVAADIGESALFLHHDVRDEASWKTVVAASVARFGRLDILINNAGVLRHATLEEETTAGFSETLQVNLFGVFHGMRAVLGPMRTGGGGSIVNISSDAGLKGMRGVGSYSTSKWAVRGITKTAALEFAPSQIRVNSVHPGAIDTAMIEHAKIQRGPGLMPSVPLGRIGLPDEAANLVLFLASDASSYITGAEFVIDGGVNCG